MAGRTGLNPANVGTARALRMLAETAARAGARLARQRFGAVHAVRWKADRSEVTEVDEAAQRAVITCIQAARPADAFICEETQPEGDTRAPAPSDATLCWVIDPLDGTRNYVRGLPHYACSVAAMLGGFPIVGAICDAVHDVMYSGSQAEGAFLDGTTLRAEARGPAPPADRPRTPIVAIPSTRHGRAFEIVHDWVDRMIVRNFGSAALHLALVAAGQLDAALATNCKLWDLAAGWVLVTGAGGRMSSPDGAPLFPLDVARYAGEDLPSLAAKAELHAGLIHP
ncbi:MAG: hypothetical protein KKB50_14175 [Planctomycetes bacterium]|nr:hypothetical protein [Planctomycetota bacterium]